MSVSTTDAVDTTVVHVIVDVSIDAESRTRITCDPPVRTVTETEGPDVSIHFRLRGDDWVFPDTDAIVVTDGGDQFPEPSDTVRPRLAKLLDCNSATGTFSYTVTVQNRVTGQRSSIDPVIKNEV